MKQSNIVKFLDRIIKENLSGIIENAEPDPCYSVKTFKWKDTQGVEHIIPDGSCVICENCTDVWLDPFRNNQIYACKCKLGKELEFQARKNPDDKFCSGYKREVNL